MDAFHEPPASAEELDALFRRIDAGDGYFASLSDEQRGQLKEELTDAWLSDYLHLYPLPARLEDAVHAYRAIESGDKYPHVNPHIRNDLLLHFNEHFGEGGPEHWDNA